MLQDHIQFILRTVRRLQGESRPIDLLDIGCSSGTLLHELSRRGIPVCGLDISEEAVTYAREVYRLECEVGDLEHFPWKDRTFSIITLFHVLEHVANPRAFLGSVRKRLRTGGVLIVQVPNLRSWQFRCLGRRWHGLDVPRHLVNFPETALKDLLGRSGFQVLRQKRFSLRDDAAALLSSLFPVLDPKGRSVRERSETARAKSSGLSEMFLDFAYFSLLLPAVPLALCDSLAGHGATIMIEAQSL
ncbi:MAG: class I SAM-dependent methyltransferase [Acidobacteriia bacterium]|nr:class I SAM-dependent methyltransferase [Terriglobia bacterium]